MLQHIISNKVQKSKQNIETYLSNSSQTQAQQPKEQAAPPPSTQASTVPRPVQQQTASTFHSQPNNASSVVKNNKPLAKNQFQLKLITIQGKQLTKQGMIFRFSKQEGKLQFLYEQDGIKTRLETKRESLVNKRVKPNFSQGSCVFQMRASLVRKQDAKQMMKGSTIWTQGKQNVQVPITVWFKDKQQLKPLMESPFMEGLVDFNSTTSTTQVAKSSEVVAQQANQQQQDHTNVKLSMPTSAQQAQSEKIRKIIKQMKEQDKVTVLMQVFKIKKQYQDPNLIKKLKCPIYYCEKKSYKDIQQLKNHLKMKHPQLSRHGIQLSQFDGTFQYGNKALDLALFIGRLFPQQMKKIIKQMKTKPPQ